MKPRISIIAAIDAKRGLGHDNELLVKIPEDSKRLRRITNGHPLVMGRKTFDSFPGLLSNRTHIVVTRDTQTYQHAAVKPHIVVSSLEQGIIAARNAPGAEEIFIFGGGQIYKAAMEADIVDRLYLTVINHTYEADTFFPDYSKFQTVLEKEEREDDGLSYTFITLEK